MSSNPTDMVVQLTVGDLHQLVQQAVDAALDRRAAEERPEVLTTEQVAKLLDRHPKTVPALIDRGMPAHYISDREPRFKRSEVLAWLDSLPGRGLPAKGKSAA